MSFDFATAIAKMGGPLDGLRSRSPELGFIFDQVEDAVYLDEKYGDPSIMLHDRDEARSDADRAENLVQEAADRFAQIRDMLLVVSRMSGVNRECEGMIKQCAGMADDATVYIERMTQ